MASETAKPRHANALVPQDFQNANRRESDRTPTTRTLAILPCNATADWKFLDAELFDFSSCGLGLISSHRFSPGEQFLAKLRIRRHTTLLMYTVKHCHSKGNKYRVGAQFSGITATSFKGDPDSLLDAFRSK